MSTIKVEVTRINDVRPHSNADTLELATVGGWQMCVKKGVDQNGDPVVYFEQGVTLPRKVADRLGVTQYLSERTDINNLLRDLFTQGHNQAVLYGEVFGRAFKAVPTINEPSPFAPLI